MAEVFKAEQAQISAVEKEAKEKKHEALTAELAARRDVFFSQANEAGKLYSDAEKSISDPKAKADLKSDREQIRGHLTKVAEKGRAILTSEKKDKTHPGFATIGQLAESIKNFVAAAKENVPIYLAMEKAKGLHRKAEPEIQKALELKDPQKKKDLKPWQIREITGKAFEKIDAAEEDIRAYIPENFASEQVRAAFLAVREAINKDRAALAAINLENIIEGSAEKSDANVQALATASKAFDETQTSVADVLKWKNQVLTDKEMSAGTLKDRIKSMWGSARADFDKLCTVNRQLKQIKDPYGMAPEYHSLYDRLLRQTAAQIQDMADVKLYCETNELVSHPSMNKYFKFNPDGTVEETSEFKGLNVWKQEELLKQLHELPMKIQMEMEEKMGTPEEKDILEGKKKLGSGDWVGAKQDLLKYYNANVNKEGRDEVRIAEAKELLKQVAKLEIAQATARLVAMRQSLEGRYDWRIDPGAKTSYGTHTRQEAYMYLDAMSHVLVEAERMVENGEVLTIGDAEIKLRKMAFGLNTGESMDAVLTDKEKLRKKSDEDLKKDKEETKKRFEDDLKDAKDRLERHKRGDLGIGAIPGVVTEVTPEMIEYDQKRIEEMQAKMEAYDKMTPEQYRILQEGVIAERTHRVNFRNGLRHFQGGFNGGADVFDVFKQQRLLNEPDATRREENILKMAKTARDRGLPELARQYYGMYFQKELGDQAKFVDRKDILKKLVEDSDNRERIDEQVDIWKEDFKKKTGREPGEADVDNARGQMVRAMVDEAYSKEVKRKVHESFKGKDDPRAKIWDDAYGGAVAIEDIGQSGTFEGIWTDESWNALPAKVAISSAIIIVAATGAGVVVELAGAGAVTSALIGGGARVGLRYVAGRAAGWGADLAVESLVFVSTEGLLNGAIQGDWSTFESGGGFLKAWGHNALTLGTLKGVGGGVGKLRKAAGKGAAAEVAGLPRGLAGEMVSDAGWWAGRTVAEASALTGMAWAQSKMEGKQFGSRDAFRSFGENVIFSAAISISHGIMGKGAGAKEKKAEEYKSKEHEKASKEATKEVVKAEELRTKMDKAKEKLDKAKEKGKDTTELEKDFKKAEAEFKASDVKVDTAILAEKTKAQEADNLQKEQLLQQHIEGMCLCHRSGMKSIIDQMGLDKVTEPIEKSKLLDQALKKIQEYKTAQDKNEGGNHIAKARDAVRQKLLDPNTVEGKDLAAKLDSKKVKVQILEPDGTVKAEMEMTVDKHLLSPDTLLKIAAGEPVVLTEVDVYLHKHMMKAMEQILDRNISDNAELATKRQEILDALAKGEDITKIVESISNNPKTRERLIKELKAAEEKVRQGTEVFTNPHAEMNAEGKNIAKEYMHETVGNVIDKFAADYEKETGKKLNPKALEKVKMRIIEAGIDQHIDNPPQYVSHGFDHSLRVMENVRRLLAQTPEQAAKGPPEAVQGMMDKYKISRSQAELLTQLVGVCHDFGYPTVGDLNKSLHAVTGTYRFLVDIGIPLGEAMGLDLKNNVEHKKLIKNFAHAIECHSADKKESSHKDVEGELKFDRKINFKIKIPGTDIFYYQEFLFMAKDEAAFRETGTKFFKVNLNIDIRPEDITVDKGKFEGRYMDAPGTTKKGQIPAGIEYNGAELNDSTKVSRKSKERNKFDPLLALVRYADNLDMDSSRFSPFQRSESFTHVYERLGAERSVEGEKTLSAALKEQLLKTPPSLDSARDVLGKTEKMNGKPIMYEGELLSLAKKLISGGGADSMSALNKLLDGVQLVKYGKPPTPLSPEYVKDIKAQIEATAANKDLPMVTAGKKTAKDLQADFQGTLSKNIFAEESKSAESSAKEARVKADEAKKANSPEAAKLEAEAKQLEDALKHLPTVEKYLNSVNEESFRHFGGCNPVEVGGVKFEGGTISVGMKADIIKQYKGLSAHEDIPKPGGKPGETIPLNIPISVYQVWRAVEAYESVTVNGKKLKIDLKVGDKTFSFDPNKYGEGSGESASSAFLREYKAWEAANVQ